MAATGYSPIQLYYSTTASAAPTAGNLASGELAINITDGKLYYKDNAGAVQLLSTSTTANGTANGVLYLNGSKVATAGSALTFDGTNMGVGGVSSGVRLDVYGSITARSGTVTADAYTNYGTNLTLNSGGSLPILFQLNGSEAMRLTSTGLGIGTSSIFSKLNIQNATARIEFGETSGSSYIESLNNARTSTAGFRIYGSEFKVFTGAAGAYGDRLTVDTSGNLGLGVTPSAWGNGRVALDVKSNGAVYSGTNMVGLSGNAYDDGSWKRKAAAGATLYEASSQHAWYITGSSTAGSTISWTQAMTLDADGDLGIGTTSPVGLGSSIATIDIANTNGGGIRFRTSGAGNSAYLLANSSGVDLFTGDAVYMRFGTSGTERARIDSSGNFLVATSTAVSGYRAVIGGTTGGLYIGSTPVATSGALLTLRDGSATVSNTTLGSITFSSSPGTDYYIGKKSESGVGSLVFGNANNGTEYARIDSSGNLGLGVTPSAWGASYKVIDYSSASALYGNGALNGLASNTFNNGTNWIYKLTTTAGRYDINGATHAWFTAPSGTAGNAISFTQVMTLDASGNWVIGATSAGYTTSGRIVGYINGTSSSLLGFGIGGAQAGYVGAFSSGLEIAAEGAKVLMFTTNAAERARIDSSGNLLVGTTSAGAGAIVDVQSTTKGVRFPNMTTTQKNAITPAAGTVVFDTTLAKLCVYSGSAWQTITSV